MTRRRSNCKKDKEAKQCGSNKKRPPCLRKAVSLLCMVLFPLDKFKYMKLHLVCFRKQNIRKIVNILPVIFGC